MRRHDEVGQLVEGERAGLRPRLVGRGIIVPGVNDRSADPVASSGEQPDLAWDFVQKNFDAPVARQGPLFRDLFIADFMTDFSDNAHGGRVMAERALETIAISADLKARALPAVDAWIKAHGWRAS